MKIKHIFSSRRTKTIDHHNDHSKAFPALTKEVIKVSDLILYVLDARHIDETRNFEIEKYIKNKGKKVITVINKSDLSKNQKKEDLSDLKPYFFISCKNYKGIRALRDQIKIEVKRLRKSEIDNKSEHDADEDKLIKNSIKTGKTQFLKLTRKAHVGIVGYPNTGKSTIIKTLTHTSASKSSSQSGFTKGIQKVRFGENILILDTPGVIEEAKKGGIYGEFEKHVKAGARTYSSAKDPEMIVSTLLKENREEIDSFYKIDTKGDPEVLLEEVGKKRKFLKKGGEVDTDRTARLILKDWQLGNIKNKED